MASLRQSFLNGSLTRLLDPDAVLRTKIVEFVGKGEFGFASGQRPDGTFDRIWFEEPLGYEDVTFDSGVFLLSKAKAKALKEGTPTTPVPGPEPQPVPIRPPDPAPGLFPSPTVEPRSQQRAIRLSGSVPPEVWNRIGTKLLPKLRSGSDLGVSVNFTVTVSADVADGLIAELKQILADLGLGDSVSIQ